MGIYIDGMEMPKSCESCPCKTADAFGGLGCQATGYIPLRKADQDRPDWCPLVPVPAHGRLIDKDALKADISASVVFSGREGNAEIIGAKKIINRLHVAPTIIPAEGGDAE